MIRGPIDFYTAVCAGGLLVTCILGIVCNVTYMVNRMYLSVGDVLLNILWYLAIASPFAAVLIHLLSLQA